MNMEEHSFSVTIDMVNWERETEWTEVRQLRYFLTDERGFYIAGNN